MDLNSRDRLIVGPGASRAFVPVYQERWAAPSRPRPVLASLSGFSLVELMIAMALGLFLISGAITLFAATKRSSDFSAEMTRMQESSRYLLSALGDDVRMAGHQGCLDGDDQTVTMVANDPPSSDLRRTSITGSVVQPSGEWQPVLELGSGTGAFTVPTINKAVPGSHVIAIQFGGPQTRELLGPLVSGGQKDASGLVRVDGDPGIGVGELAIISTCEGGELFRVTSVSHDGSGNASLGHSATLNSQGSFQEIYGEPSVLAQTRIMPFRTHVYFVAQTNRSNGQGDPVRALYQQSMPFDDAANPPVMLAEGVEHFRVSFGIADDSGRLRFVDADEPEFDPTRVRVVQLGLLMSSWNAVTDEVDTRAYSLAGHVINPSSGSVGPNDYSSDRRLRLAFNTTVTVRNRGADR